MKIMNLLPDKVVKDGITYVSSEFPCEIYVEHVNLHHENGEFVSKPILHILGLPKSEKDVVYIVSPEIAELKNKRNDLVVPDCIIKI